MESLIQVKDVSYSYQRSGNLQGSRALDKVSLAVNRGEFVAVVGPNGSGKSTLAKHLNGLLLPGEGQVLVDEMDTRDEARVWDIRRIVGMVFQNPDNQLVGTTVEEDVAFGPENLGVEPAEIRQRVNQALDLVGMGSFKEHQPHRLSGGQKQRVAIAGALAMQPRCLVLDEATAMLDPRGRKLALDTVRQLNREQGLAVVLITHFMDEAVLADRVVVMDEGRIMVQGTPLEVFRQARALRKLGLEVPVAVELGSRLRRLGWEVPEEMVELEELVNYLAGLLSGKPGFPAGRRPDLSTGGKPTFPAGLDKQGVRPDPEIQVSSSPTPLIKLEQVSYTYGPGLPWEYEALSGIDLVVEQGDFLGIAGHTGSGKSTLIQLFNGLVQPVSGRVMVMGRDIWLEKQDWQSLRCQVGLVFQFPEHQLFESTVFDEVAFGPRNLKWPEERVSKAVTRALEAVGIDTERYARVSPFALSGGQQRRVALAGILSMEPSVLVLDEPVAGLDPQGRRELLELLIRLNRERNLTVVMVSHNMEELALCARRLVVLNQGRKELDGPLQEVFSHQRELEDMGLGVPEGARLVLGLRERGIPVETGALTWEEAWTTVTKLL